MVTLVGTQTNFMDALKDLLELEYDALETYTAAIDRLASQEYKNKLGEFKSDHELHINKITELLKSSGEEVPHGPSGKQVLLIARVAISKIMGDTAILGAMLTAEEDTNTAYERMVAHEGKTDKATDILKRGLEDEKKHRDWIIKATSA